MTHHAPIATGEPVDFAPSASSGDPKGCRPGSRWTAAKMAQFLRQLSATHSVSAAARSVGMSRQSAYRLRSRLKGMPFDLAWEVAFQHSFDNLAHAMLERAINGVEVPVFHRGEQVGSYRRFDERLSVALLAMRTARGNVPLLGRLAPEAECHSGRFEALLAEVAAGPPGEAPVPDPGPAPVSEIGKIWGYGVSPDDSDEILATLREIYGDEAG
jgi:hypothetical protein